MIFIHIWIQRDPLVCLRKSSNKVKFGLSGFRQSLTHLHGQMFCWQCRVCPSLADYMFWALAPVSWDSCRWKSMVQWIQDSGPPSYRPLIESKTWSLSRDTVVSAQFEWGPFRNQEKSNKTHQSPQCKEPLSKTCITWRKSPVENVSNCENRHV